MTADELRNEMHAEFKDVRADSAALRNEMTGEFKNVHAQFESVDAQFESVRAELKAVEDNLLARIEAEGETIRRHFDVMVEQVNDAVKVVADGTARNTERLDDHETRIKAIEGAP